MLARASQQLARRGFHTTRAQLSSPYHYPEGPLSNLPFNPRKRGYGFTVAYWSFMATGFGLPFGIAGTLHPPLAWLLVVRRLVCLVFDCEKGPGEHAMLRDEREAETVDRRGSMSELC
jgi:hypothetical protein